MDPTDAQEDQHSKDTLDVAQPQRVPPLTSRHVKKLYKISLAFFINQDEARKINPGTLSVEQNSQVAVSKFDADCPRCFMIKRGNIMITESIKCTVLLMMPSGRHELYEPSEISAEDAGLSGLEEEDAAGNAFTIVAIATSVAAGSELSSRVSKLNEGPAKMIAERRIMESPKVELAQHTCIVIKTNINDSAIITMSDKPRVMSELPIQGMVGHVVIYAPSGAGKTEFQRRLAAQGCLLYDTDDIPAVSGHELESILQKGSVVTNRLDLLQYAPCVIAFLPNTADDLRRHTEPWKLTDADYDHWFKCHQSVQLPENALIIHYSKTYMSEWFMETQKLPAERSPRGVERDVLDYIRCQEEAASKLFKLAQKIFKPNINE